MLDRALPRPSLRLLLWLLLLSKTPLPPRPPRLPPCASGRRKEWQPKRGEQVESSVDQTKRKKNENSDSDNCTRSFSLCFFSHTFSFSQPPPPPRVGTTSGTTFSRYLSLNPRLLLASAPPAAPLSLAISLSTPASSSRRHHQRPLRPHQDLGRVLQGSDPGDDSFPGSPRGGGGLWPHRPLW